MSTFINMYRVPEMDINYDNVPYFASKESQNDWFAAKRKGRIEVQKISVDPSRTTVTVGIDIIQLEDWGINYCTLIRDNKLYFYFVTDYEYKTSGSTTLILELDVFQTYMFEFYMMDSFIDRCHVDRWTVLPSGKLIPTKNYMDEGLQFGDYEYKTDLGSLAKFRDKFLITSTVPLGKNDWDDPNQGTGGGGSQCGDWDNGLMSVEAFRFTKGWEGFSSKPYDDGYGFITIGYGITQRWQKPIFDQLNKPGGCTEKEAAMATYEHLRKDVGPSIIDAVKKLGCNQQYQFDALCDLAFNAGASAVTGSNELTQAIKRDPKNEAFIRQAWIKYKPAGGVERRRQECDMFFNRYSTRPISVKGGGTITDNYGNGWMPECGTDPKPPTTCKIDFKTPDGLEWTYPCHGRIEAKFPNYPSGGWHSGTDIGCPVGTPVYATRDLYIEAASEIRDPQTGKLTSFGIYIKARVINTNYKVWFAHLSKHKCKTGDTVKCGQVIALSGNTGNSKGPHLHYELRKKPWHYGREDCIDPIPTVKLYDRI